MTRNLLFAFFGLMLVSMVLVCIRAGMQQNMFEFFNQHGSNPWYVATLLDCYWGFFIFYGWLVYQEKSWLARIPWLAAICCLGNIAVAAYGLLRTFRLSGDASFEDFLLRKQSPTARA